MLAFAFLLFVPAPLAAQDFAALDPIIQARMAKSGVPGMVVAFAAPDGTIVERGYGVRSVESRDPVKTGDLFRTGSANKMWTAAALLKIMEQRGHSVHKPLGSFVPGLRPALAKLTVAQILSHQAGLADGNATEGVLDEMSLASSVTESGYYGAFTAPGQILSYSNPGYQLAGYLIEKLTGQLYADAIDTLVMGPLGARHTFHRPLMAMTYPSRSAMHLARRGAPWSFARCRSVRAACRRATRSPPRATLPALHE